MATELEQIRPSTSKSKTYMQGNICVQHSLKQMHGVPLRIYTTTTLMRPA